MINATFRDEWFSNIQKNVLAGLTTSFALVPECIAFALVAQLNPLMGLYGAFIICALTAIFGGRPGMISGAAGSMAVVIVALVAQHGVQYLLATVVLSGIIMALFGLLRLGKLIRMVPLPGDAGLCEWPGHRHRHGPAGTLSPGHAARRNLAARHALVRDERAGGADHGHRLRAAAHDEGRAAGAGGHPRRGRAQPYLAACRRAPWATSRISPAACRPCIGPACRWTWTPCTSSSRMRR